MSSRTSEQIDQFLSQVRQAKKDTPRMTLREAVNLLGVVHFPSGWNWNEFPRLRQEDPEAYPKEDPGILDNIWNVTMAGRSLDFGTPTKEGIRAKAIGEERRSAFADQALRSSLQTLAVRCFYLVHDMRSVQVPQEDLVSDLLRIDIRTSSIGVSPDPQDFTTCHIFSSDFLRLEIFKAKSAGAKPKHDWIFFEAIARQMIEHSGIPATQQALLNQTFEIYNAPAEADEPTRSTAAEKISRIFAEYSESEN